MKFQPDRLEGVNTITRCERACISVGSDTFAHSVLVPWQGAVQPWHTAHSGELTAAHFERAAALDPEIVIFGSGERLRFVSPALYRCLIERRIGFETMDTAAACRTFNVLATEGRRVLAAVIIEAPG